MPGYPGSEPGLGPMLGGEDLRRAITGPRPVSPSWQVLGGLRNTEAIRHFVQLLSENDNKKKRQALVALARVKHASLVNPVAPLLKNRDSNVRTEAAKVLLAIGSAEAVEALAAAMGEGLLIPAIPDAAIRLKGTAGSEPTAALLAKMLVIAAKIEKPGQAKSRETGRPAEGAPPRGTERNQRRGSAQAPAGNGEQPLISVRILQAIRKTGLRSDDVLQAVGKATKASHPRIRTVAYRVQAALLRPPKQGSLLRGLVKLSPLKYAPGIPTGGERKGADYGGLKAALKDADPSVRLAGAGLCAGAPAAEVIAALEEAMDDSDPNVRASVLRVLPKLSGDDPRIPRVIARGLADEKPGVLSAAAQAAARRKDPSLAAALVEALSQPADPEGRRANALPALINAVGAVGDRSATGALVLLLANEKVRIRASAARALGNLRDPETVPALLVAARDEQPRVAGAVLSALMEFDSAIAVESALTIFSRQGLPLDVRRRMLRRIVGQCTQPGPYADWLQRGGQLSSADFVILSEIAPSAPEEWRNGFMVIATRHLDDPRAEVRREAADLLLRFRDDPAARTRLLSGLGRDASTMAAPVAEMLREIRDPAMLEQLWDLYKRLLGSRRGTSSRYPGLAKASPEEHFALCAAIIQALGQIGGDDAALALRKVSAREDAEAMEERIIDALVLTESPKSVGYLELYLKTSERLALKAIEALSRVGHLDPETARQALRRIVRNSRTPRHMSAAAADALDDLNARLVAKR